MESLGEIQMEKQMEAHSFCVKYVWLSGISVEIYIPLNVNLNWRGVCLCVCVSLCV